MTRRRKGREHGVALSKVQLRLRVDGRDAGNSALRLLKRRKNLCEEKYANYCGIDNEGDYWEFGGGLRSLKNGEGPNRCVVMWGGDFAPR